MANRTTLQFAPRETPKTIRNLILFTVICSLAAVVGEQMRPGLMDYFVFSGFGIQRGFLWQFVSYLFVLAGGSITGFWILKLFLFMYMLWIFAPQVLRTIGPSSFIKFYLGCGALSAAAAFAFGSYSGQYDYFYSGPGSSLLGLFVIWAMQNPGSDVRLYFLFPIKARYLALGALGVVLLVNLSQFDYVSLVFYLTAMAAGYLYTKLKFGHTGWRWRSYFSAKKQKKRPFRSKKEEAYVNRMLDKVSKHGEQSLTRKERRKLQKLQNIKK